MHFLELAAELKQISVSTLLGHLGDVGDRIAQEQRGFLESLPGQPGARIQPKGGAEDAREIFRTQPGG